MEHTATRTKILDRFEKRVERLTDEVSEAFEAELQRTLDDWGRRYPRHAFSAFQFHGTLSVMVKPEVYGTTDPTDWPDRARRGALATLYEEVEALIDWHIRLEWKVTTFETDTLHSRGMRASPADQKPVTITFEKDGVITVIERFATLEEAEDFLETSPAIYECALEAGAYSIDAPEEMVNPPKS